MDTTHQKIAPRGNHRILYVSDPQAERRIVIDELEVWVEPR
jgi:hypothetical protein